MVISEYMSQSAASAVVPDGALLTRFSHFCHHGPSRKNCVVLEESLHGICSSFVGPKHNKRGVIPSHPCAFFLVLSPRNKPKSI